MDVCNSVDDVAVGVMFYESSLPTKHLLDTRIRKSWDEKAISFLTSRGRGLQEMTTSASSYRSFMPSQRHLLSVKLILAVQPGVLIDQVGF